MTRAKITRPTGYNCAPQGHTVVNFPMGTIVDGEVAEWALADRAASAMLEKKVEAPEETKAPKRRGRPRKVQP